MTYEIKGSVNAAAETRTAVGLLEVKVDHIRKTRKQPAIRGRSECSSCAARAHDDEAGEWWL